MSEDTYVSVAKADNNPSPSTNAKLKKICDQLADIRRELSGEMANAALENRPDEVKLYADLDKRAKEVMDGIGCAAAAPPAVDRLIEEFLSLKHAEET